MTQNVSLYGHFPKTSQGQWMIGEFTRSLAMLGGFLGRKHDGHPGWITLWRGATKLLQLLEGSAEPWACHPPVAVPG